MPLPAGFRGLAKLKQFATLLGRHAGAGVADIDDHLSAFGFGADKNFAAVGLGFHGVAQKIIEGLS